jgi:hypothetical protein
MISTRYYTIHTNLCQGIKSGDAGQRAGCGRDYGAQGAMRTFARQKVWEFKGIEQDETFRQGNPGELLQDSFDLRNWNGALAQHFPLVVLQSNDRGWEPHAGFPGVQHQR